MAKHLLDMQKVPVSITGISSEKDLVIGNVKKSLLETLESHSTDFEGLVV